MICLLSRIPVTDQNFPNNTKRATRHCKAKTKRVKTG